MTGAGNEENWKKRQMRSSGKIEKNRTFRGCQWYGLSSRTKVAGFPEIWYDSIGIEPEMNAVRSSRNK